MTFVITGGCCNDASCVAVCPVQCIRPRPGDPDFTTAEQLYIDPETCIDCGACVQTCPVNAIAADWELPEHLSAYLGINAAYFAHSPIEESEPPDPVRRRLPEGQSELSVAVVGSGPAGCYVAAELSSIKGVSVSVFDRLPTPFGLLRAGVAPDHANTKLMSKRFSRVLARPNVHCFFNVEVGRDVSLTELLDHHHAVVWAGGASDERRLNVEGEDLPGSVSAREFVLWYNGHPDHADHEFELGGQRAIIIGNGNVALDVARVLARSDKALVATDMADHAIEALGAGGVTEIVVAGRRGPEHAAYTTSEVAALAQLEDVALLAKSEEIARVADVPDHRSSVIAAASKRQPKADERTITLRFGLQLESINGTDSVESVTFRKSDGSAETIEASLVVRAVGFRGKPVGGLPFDDTTNTLPNTAGRVWEPVTRETVVGVYCAGWIKRGATGVIGTNKTDASETVDSILVDLAAGRLRQPQHDVNELKKFVSGRQPELVDQVGWGRIDQGELQAGMPLGRPRRKAVRTSELVAMARPTS